MVTGRPLPPQMTTPVSKRIEKERSSSFLDNIAACVDEEQKLKEKKMKAKEQPAKSEESCPAVPSPFMVPLYNRGTQSCTKGCSGQK